MPNLLLVATRRAALAALLALGAACGAAGGAPRAPAAAPPTPPAPAPAAATADPLGADSGDAAPAGAFSGTLEPRERAVLRAELAGPVRLLRARVGDRVARGATLAVLDVPAVRAALASADAQVASAEAACDQAERDRSRVAELAAAGGASRAEVEEAAARARAADAARAAAQAARAAARADAARLTVRAPFAGVVERRAAAAGSVVQAGDELLTVIDPTTLELDAAVAGLAAVRPGAAARAHVAGFPGRAFAGRVVRVAPALDPATRQLRVTIALDNAAGRLPAGAWAEGRLVAPNASAAGGR